MQAIFKYFKIFLNKNIFFNVKMKKPRQLTGSFFWKY